MIKAAEIRIGNLLQSEKGFHQVIKIEEIYRVHPHPAYFIAWTAVHPVHPISGKGNSLLNELSPLSLNSELLRKCGFYGLADSNFELNGPIRLIAKPHNDSGYHLFQKEEKLAIISYLHQLQNLYFALSGEELDINWQTAA